MFWRDRTIPETDPALPPLVPQVAASGNTASGRVALAQALLCDGQYAAALAELEVALRDNPELVDGQLAKGLALARQLRFREAIEPLQRSVELSEGEQLRMAKLGLATVCLCLDQFAAALQMVEELTQQDDQDAKAHALQGEIFRRWGRNDEALEAYRRAVQRNPQLLVARWRLGEALAACDQLEPACQELRTAVQIAPTDGHVLQTLAEVLCRLGRSGEAADLLQQAIQFGRPRSEQFVALADCHLAQQRVFDALTAARTAIAMDPRQPAGHRMMAKIYSQQGRAAEANHYSAAADKLSAVTVVAAGGVNIVGVSPAPLVE